MVGTNSVAFLACLLFGILGLTGRLIDSSQGENTYWGVIFALIAFATGANVVLLMSLSPARRFRRVALMIAVNVGLAIVALLWNGQIAPYRLSADRIAFLLLAITTVSVGVLCSLCFPMKDGVP
jgi:hypothetical protein